MHELGLCEAIVDAIEARAAGREVVRVRVRVGCLLHVHPDAFAQSFSMAAAGGVAARARADLVVVPLEGRCVSCGTQFSSSEPVRLPACPSCGSIELESHGGEELVLESLEFSRAVPGAGERSL